MAWARDEKHVFASTMPAKRVTLPGGVLALFVDERDAPSLSVYRDAQGRDRYVKTATERPVRLLFPLDVDRLEPADTVTSRLVVSERNHVLSLTLATRAPGAGFTYEEAAQTPRTEARPEGLVATAAVRTALSLPPGGELFLVAKLGLDGGDFCFLEGPEYRAAAPVKALPVTVRTTPAPVSTLASGDDPVVAALRDRIAAISAQLREMEEMLAGLATASPGERRTTDPQARAAGPNNVFDATAPGAVVPSSFGDTRLPLMNWVIGPPENAGWAYGNNARRLAGRLKHLRHLIGGTAPAQVALYFDPIVAERYPMPADHSILRIGGPRPLDRLFGDDRDALNRGLAPFGAVVPLNLDLHRRVRDVAGKLRFIPNALDLDEWHPERRRRDTKAPFTVGFAASLKSSKEAEVKGYAIAREACERAGVPLLMTQKEKGQIPHDRMVEDFYSKCDVLIHPVLPGREGTSNVIMESLAIGLPVICTEASGFHGETLSDRKNALIRERSVEAFAEAIALLRDDKKMRQRLATAGRGFAERHHDLAIATRRYEALLRDLLTPGGEAKRTVCFVPFWEPAEQSASSRLRGLAVAAALNASGLAEASVGYDPNADVVVVIQMATDPLMETLGRSGQFVVYDVCDRYFENSKTFRHRDGEVETLPRYHELLERADLVIVPTPELKIEVSLRSPEKPVVHLPEVVDYDPGPARIAAPDAREVLWFGNPGRGNFESAKWLLDALRDRYGYRVRIVSKRSFFRAYPDYADSVVEWSVEAMRAAFAECSLCVVTHSPEEQTKSPNRMVAAVTHGLPTLVHSSQSCEDILRRAGADVAIVDEPDALDAALAALEDPDRRAAIMAPLQAMLAEMHGPDAIARAYDRAFASFGYPKHVDETRIGIVTHNLQIGEGAPRSLFELAKILNAMPDIDAHVYSAGEGDLEHLYLAADVPLTIFDRSVTHCVRSLKSRFGDLRAHFRDYLIRNRIEVLICNTAKTAPFAYFARELGIPSIVIVRESFDPADRFTQMDGEARVAVEVGLVEAEEVVFVAGESRDAWDDYRFEGGVSIINNGVDPDRFTAALDMPRAAARAALGIPDDQFVAVCVGSIGTRKGQAALVQAFTDLPEDVRERSTILFLGAAEVRHLVPFRAALDAAHARIGERMRHIPAVEEIGLYYRAADVFLINSSNEAYPRSVMEALLFGLPVISTNVFGMRTQVLPGRNGLMYEVDDMAAWSEAFCRLARDTDLRDRLGTAAARSFWRHTTKAEMIARYRSLIGRLSHRYRSTIA